MTPGSKGRPQRGKEDKEEKEGTSQMEGYKGTKEGLAETNGSAGEKKIWWEKHREKKPGGKQKQTTAVK